MIKSTVSIIMGLPVDITGYVNRTYIFKESMVGVLRNCVNIGKNRHNVEHKFREYTTNQGSTIRIYYNK